MTAPALFDVEGGEIRDAALSADEVYRYALARTWNPALPPVAFCMLNPSKADATLDDATICKIRTFAKRWGYGGLRVVNLFAYRATDPKELVSAREPIGEDNDDWIIGETKGLTVVAAWGASVPSYWSWRPAEVHAMLTANGTQLHHLGLTKDGHPRHPLYLRGDTMPQPWKEAA